MLLRLERIYLNIFCSFSQSSCNFVLDKNVNFSMYKIFETFKARVLNELIKLKEYVHIFVL